MAHVDIRNQEQLDAEATLTEIQKLQTRAYRQKSEKFYIEGVRNFIRKHPENPDPLGQG